MPLSPYKMPAGKIATQNGKVAMLTEAEFRECCCCLYAVYTIHSYLTYDCVFGNWVGDFCLGRGMLNVCMLGGEFGGESWKAVALVGRFKDQLCTQPCAEEPI